MEAGRGADQDFRGRRRQRRDLDRRHVRRQLCRDRRHQPGAVPHQNPGLGRPRAAAVPGGVPRQGPADGVLRHDRPQRLSAGAQQDLFASAAAGRRRLEHRQQPQPPHLQRSRRACRRPQPARLSDPELRPRHGQRQHRDDARDRRTDPRQRPPLGRISARRTSSRCALRQVSRRESRSRLGMECDRRRPIIGSDWRKLEHVLVQRAVLDTNPTRHWPND